MAIELLSNTLISQIAAGEVVERPASVVKELVENALDAGAESIHINVQNGGRRLIRVSDNGAGISEHEVALAVTRHATSKIRAIEDLEQIRTLGFRGEALSSIAAVSQFNLTSRYRGEQVGTRVRVDGGELLDLQAVGAPVGTVVSVENIFFNTPARLKFLKKESTEKRHIMAIVTRYAMAYPSVRFTLEQDGRELFRSTGGGQLADVLVRVLGIDSFRQMVAVDLADISSPSYRVEGFVSSPSLNRADRGYIDLFVNGRWVQDSKLTYAVVQAYHALLPPNRFPLATLMISLPPHEVDVNVHPTKAEVRFRDPNALFTLVQRGVREAVMRAQDRPSIQSSVYERSQEGQSSWGDSMQPSLELAYDTTALTADDSQGDSRQLDFDHIPEGAGHPERPRTLPLLRVVGQVGATYIIAEGPAGMYLIDQHGAHHRVLFEDLMGHGEQVQHHAYNTVQTVELSQTDAQHVRNCIDTIRGLGVDVEGFGGNTFLVRGVPEMLADADAIMALKACADVEDKSSDLRVDIARKLSQLAAVKAGQILRQDDMQALVRKLERVQNPLECPSGKPTFIHFSGSQLAREFGR